MEEPIVKIEQGQIRGKTVTDCKGGIYFSFQGIPYAKPPIGNLRFKAPQPPETWDSIFDATKEGNACYSRDLLTKVVGGSEDCLYLNVFTPKISPGTDNILKPVMVWIHGGAFVTGSSKTEFYGPDFLIAQDVVIVSFNYRLGVLGFLSLEDSSLEVPGNAALKDMVMALKWVQKNIINFCGDPDNVTIFGESAGAAAVHYLCLSPMSKGLFHKAIAQSGSALCPWAQGTRYAKYLAEASGCNATNEKEILEHLVNLPVDKIFEIQETFKDYELMDQAEIRRCGPVVEKTSKEPMFLSEEPIDIIKSGKYNMVPFLTGYTSREGMLFAFFQRGERNNCDAFVPLNLHLEKGSEAFKEISKKIKSFYFNDEEPGTENVEKIYVVDTDNYFLRGIHSTVRNQSMNSKAPIYFYRMSLDTSLNVLKKMVNIKATGAAHADDLSYLFKAAMMPNLKAGSIEDISVRRFTKLWATFARNGNPNPIKKDPLISVEWKPVKTGELHYLNIDENLTVGINPEAERMAFWDKIYKANQKTRDL